ncbi:MAG TPA: MBL fold metallo-hydrolase [Blastocatellia bacterium]|nr:MBL fold metallo-hydrolase [Blastocatellia bacterium]
MGLILKQLRAGRDFAAADKIATSMANFIYIIGDDETRECLLVDPAWDVAGVLNCVESEGLRLSGVLVTHYHPDHVGGNMFGHGIEGLAELLAKQPVRIHVNEHEGEGIKTVTGVSENDLERHAAGDVVRVGSIDITLMHTPGHTPGSQCFLVGSNLVSGDTLFIGGCGRVDLPGSDPEQMYYSLTRSLARLPDETRLYPGHDYAARPVSTIGDEMRENYYLKVPTLADWMRLMNRP